MTTVDTLAFVSALAILALLDVVALFLAQRIPVTPTGHEEE